MLREDQRLGRRAPARPRQQPAAAQPRQQPAAAEPRVVPPSARQPNPTVNPYVRWVHEHPAVLLAEPTPAALRERLGDALAAGGAPIVVDLGCGSGNFLLESARREPATRFVGFEVRYKRLVKAARKVERAGLHTVLLLREVAERLPDYFAPGSLHAVTVHFPDPWPRRSDWKKRMVSPALLQTLARLLEPGGRFHLRTDHSGYFLHVLSLLRDAPGLEPVRFSNGLRPSADGADAVRSEFELMFRGQGKPVYRLVLQKPARGNVTVLRR